jgi:hypothetical protein
MAAQGGVRHKILRVSMPFEKRRNSIRKPNAVLTQKGRLFWNVSEPWSMILKVHLWAADLREGMVRSCAEIARKEGITPARVSQLWPLCRITREQVEPSLLESTGRRISLRTLIRCARNTDVKFAGSVGRNMVCG